MVNSIDRDSSQSPNKNDTDRFEKKCLYIPLAPADSSDPKAPNRPSTLPKNKGPKVKSWSAETGEGLYTWEERDKTGWDRWGIAGWDGPDRLLILDMDLYKMEEDEKKKVMKADFKETRIHGSPRGGVHLFYLVSPRTLVPYYDKKGSLKHKLPVTLGKCIDDKLNGYVVDHYCEGYIVKNPVMPAKLDPNNGIPSMWVKKIHGEEGDHQTVRDMDDDEVEKRFKIAMKKDQKFKNLWIGDFEQEGYDDRSSAEAALAQKIGYYFDRDEAIIEKMMDLSGAKKWHERLDRSYRDSIIRYGLKNNGQEANLTAEGLDFDAEIPSVIKPSWYDDGILSEMTWLPWKEPDPDKEKKIYPHPYILVLFVKENDFHIVDYSLHRSFEHGKTYRIRGAVPGYLESKTLWSKEGVRQYSDKKIPNTNDIDKALEEAINTHIELDLEQALILRRWIESTYFYDMFDAFPILNIAGISESGKTRTLKLIEATAYHGLFVDDITSANLFRDKEELRPTHCIDEQESLWSKRAGGNLRTLLNSSYLKGGTVPRRAEKKNKNGKTFVRETFNVFSPTAIAGISGLEGVLASRAIRIIQQRSDKNYPYCKVSQYTRLRDDLYTLRFYHCPQILTYIERESQNDLKGRFHELFLPLLVMTKLFGDNVERQTILDWAKQFEEDFRAEALNAPDEEQVLHCLLAWVDAPDWYMLKDLKEKVNNTYSRDVSSNFISSVLRRLGLSSRKKRPKGNAFWCSLDLARAKARPILGDYQPEALSDGDDGNDGDGGDGNENKDGEHEDDGGNLGVLEDYETL